MRSILYFICYTAVAILSCIFPSDVGWYLALAFILTFGAYILYVMIPYRYVSSIKEDDIHFINISDVTDLPYGLGLVYVILLFAMIVVPIFLPAQLTIWIFYAATMLITYVFPTLQHIICRIKLYFKLKHKGCRVKLRELIFTGRRNIHYVEVQSEERKYKIGLLGGIGQMRYNIDGGEIASQRVNSVMREYILEFESMDKEIANLCVKLYSSGPKSQKLNTSDTCDYLMLQQNAYIVSDGKLVSRGDAVNGMRLIDMSMGAKYIR